MDSCKETQQLDLVAAVDLIDQARYLSEMVDIQLWSQAEALSHPFFFADGAGVLLMQDLVPDRPLGLVMDDARYQARFKVFSSTWRRGRASFAAADARPADKTWVDSMIRKISRCEAIYAFTNLGFLVQPEDLKKIKQPQPLKDFVVRAMQTLMQCQVPLLVNSAAMEAFSSKRQVILPMLGQLHFSADAVVPYLTRMTGTTSKNLGVSIRLTERKLTPFALLLLQDELVLYLPASDLQEERFILLDRQLLPRLLQDLEAVSLSESRPVDEGLLADYLKALPALYKKSPGT